MKTIFNLGLGISVCALAIGCGAPLEGDMASGDGADLNVEVASEGEALSTTEQCATTTPHRTTTGEPADFTTNNTYDPAGCHDAYLVDANDYDGTIPSGAHYILHGGAAATSSACQKQRLMMYVWRKNGTPTPTFVTSKSKWGTWNGFKCTTEFQVPAEFGIGPNGGTSDYRFALSARTYPTAGVPSGSYTRNPIVSQFFSH